ncbi:MAG: methyltransferase domain-containing protein [Deltaproteobacteria bacterium]|nr:methyltransferase domain-containing protein [Deltaproteobacteria bacterium]
MTIDKNRVKMSFSRQAHVYEENAPLQKEVAKRLISAIRLTSHISRLTALDIGIGTGFASKEFSKSFPNAGVFGCDISYGMLKEADKTGAILAEADAERLPYKSDTFDLAFSSLAFQWTSLRDSINEAFRVLRPHGRIYFSTFGEKTLRELADSYNSALGLLNTGKAAGTMKFESSQRISAIMEATGFKGIEIETDFINDRYSTPEALLRSLKAIGAGNPSRDFHPSRNILNETFRVYRERYGNEDGVSATFEVVYVRGVKG